MGKKLNLTGQTFNRLTVLKEAGTDGKNILWDCLCKCGNIITASGYRIKNGHCKSCGCLQKEIASINGKTSGTHYMSKSPEYSSWRAMLKRCKDLENINYGGRGIKVFPLWKTNFQAFYNHIGPKPGKGYSVDRINNDGNYEPGNVKWATIEEQNYNRRKFGSLSKFTDQELLNEYTKRGLRLNETVTP